MPAREPAMTRKEYTGEDITVTFDLKRCIHARNCFLQLPEVFDPLETSVGAARQCQCRGSGGDDPHLLRAWHFGVVPASKSARRESIDWLCWRTDHWFWRAMFASRMAGVKPAWRYAGVDCQKTSPIATTAMWKAGSRQRASLRQKRHPRPKRLADLRMSRAAPTGRW